MLTYSEVARHDSKESCWVIIENEVYDVTDFIEDHPGGASIILRFAGKDATEEYLPVHPPEKHLGTVDAASRTVLDGKRDSIVTDKKRSKAIPIELCFCLDDLEQAAKAVLSKRGWTYYSSAAENLRSHQLNLQDWGQIIFRPRVLRNVQRVDMSRTILGHKSSLPFFIAPAALGRLGHADGELCLARGAARRNIPYAVSTASSVSTSELSQCMQAEAAGGCLFYQLYVKKKQNETRDLIRHARNLGFKGLIVTVDTPVVGKREEDDRHKAELVLDAGGDSVTPNVSTMEQGTTERLSSEDLPVLRGPYSSTLSWEDLKWIREEWGSGPMCLKGITTAEDARLACDLGFESIYLSNHGGRQLDSSPSSLRTLLEIRKFFPDVFERCEVLVDGGVRRGTDILKALCLGAAGVGIGRPFMYALSAYGTKGVLKAIQVLSDELETSMRLLGVTSLDELRPHTVNTRSLDLLMMTDLAASTASKARL